MDSLDFEDANYHQEEKIREDITKFFDFHIFENIFAQLFYITNPKNENYEQAFTKLNNFILTCKLFLSSTKTTLFTLEVCEKKIKLPYNLHLKISYIKHQAQKPGFRVLKLDNCLIYSIAAGFIDTIEPLIDLGANINARKWDSNSNLLSAVQNNKIKTVKKILEQKNVFLNVQNHYENTCLIEACKFGFKDIVEVLLSKDAVGLNLNIQNCNGDSALHISISEGFEEITYMLLAKNNLDINLRNKEGNTPLILGSRFNNEKLVTNLLSNKNLHLSSQQDEERVLTFSCFHGFQYSTKIQISQKFLENSYK